MDDRQADDGVPVGGAAAYDPEDPWQAQAAGHLARGLRTPPAGVPGLRAIRAVLLLLLAATVVLVVASIVS